MKVTKKFKMKGLALALTMLAASLTGCVYAGIVPEAAAPTAAVAPPAAAPLNPTWAPAQSDSPSLPLPSIADVVAAVKPGVVAINTEIVSLDFFNRPLTEQGAGSGWIIDSDGIIVTNNHVVEDARTISITMDDGSTYNVEPKDVHTDVLNDLAVIKINAHNLPALRVGGSSNLRVGDWVVAIGNSLGLGISAKEGIMSRKGVSITPDQGDTLYNLIETSAAINPGNSGGPLVNMAGEVIGITSAKIASVGVEGMGYAISTETAMPIIEQLIKNGFVIRPWLGVSLYTVDRFARLRYGLAVSSGVLVTQVASGGPAAMAGIEPGDVIVAAGSKDVSSEEELNRIIYSSNIGQPLDITYFRDNVKKTVQVTPTQTPPPG